MSVGGGVIPRARRRGHDDRHVGRRHDVAGLRLDRATGVDRGAGPSRTRALEGVEVVCVQHGRGDDGVTDLPVAAGRDTPGPAERGHAVEAREPAARGVDRERDAQARPGLIARHEQRGESRVRVGDERRHDQAVLEEVEPGAGVERDGPLELPVGAKAIAVTAPSSSKSSARQVGPLFTSGGSAACGGRVDGGRREHHPRARQAELQAAVGGADGSGAV